MVGGWVSESSFFSWQFSNQIHHRVPLIVIVVSLILLRDHIVIKALFQKVSDYLRSIFVLASMFVFELTALSKPY